MAKNNEQKTTMKVTARNILVPFSSVTFTVKWLNSLDIQLTKRIQQLKDRTQRIYKDENTQLT